MAKKNPREKRYMSQTDWLNGPNMPGIPTGLGCLDIIWMVAGSKVKSVKGS